ncbi:MlaA family lipoprotein [Parendozoicomonas haliclonae]|uniref:Putative phospholipid-binding lipoprotein MlaA n=1 Tax=Parendozoicomonas haliclonae TaxID=1960125 RepID=A0A1X7AHJ9_9GAMM|nr:VacJ family lipoprotein [Parendozoicomonas haliclonae]SMA42995.1 putative phospholipid-binding lipoprotein MlaA precursor [Parendozoicomonas haliclonae]
MLNNLRGWLGAGCFMLVAAGASVQASEDVVSYDDPWEKVNRATFAFNDTLDTWVLKPVAKGYDTVTPKPVQGLVTNFFQNLGEIRNVANSLLQFELKEAGVSTGRFLVNSTVGMLGMVDVGTAVGMDHKYNDFGMTLARWHVPSGPYVVLPVLGPRTVRSTAGLLPDSAADPVTYVTPSHDKTWLQVTDTVNFRADLLDKEGLVVGDKYTFIRDAYLQRRAFLITGEAPRDDF